MGAERGAAEEASAELFTTDPAPDGRAAPDDGPVGPDRSPNVGSAAVDPSGSLSLCRLSGAELAGLGREGLLGVLGDIER